MFRFATPDVSPSTKPRGLVDLSKVSDVTPAKDATGRNNSLMLSTPTGRVLYVADSETEQVEWLSAIEGTVQKLVRQVRTCRYRAGRTLHWAKLPMPALLAECKLLLCRIALSGHGV